MKSEVDVIIGLDGQLQASVCVCVGGVHYHRRVYARWNVPFDNEALCAVHDLDAGVPQAPVDAEVSTVEAADGRPQARAAEEEDLLAPEGLRQLLLPALPQARVDGVRHFLRVVAGVPFGGHRSVSLRLDALLVVTCDNDDQGASLYAWTCPCTMATVAKD